MSSTVSVLARRFRTRAVVELENLALRHQLQVLRRQRPGRLRLLVIDRWLWVWLYRLWPRCLEVMVLVKPATVVQWHRQGFRLFWRWRSRSGRPSVEREIRDLIRQMSNANPLWGAPRIHGELLKLGITVSQATVAKYIVRRRGTPSPTWRTSYLLRDRDAAYGVEYRKRVEAMDITEVITAPRSPWQNAYVERVIGSIRRECLDYLVIVNARHLRRVLSWYLDYYHRTRTHLSLDKDCPDSRPIMPRSPGKVVAIPQVAGLHHRYERLAA
jgi:hypothetical protein